MVQIGFLPGNPGFGEGFRRRLSCPNILSPCYGKSKSIPEQPLGCLKRLILFRAWPESGLSGIKAVRRIDPLEEAIVSSVGTNNHGSPPSFRDYLSVELLVSEGKLVFRIFSKRGGTNFDPFGRRAYSQRGEGAG